MRIGFFDPYLSVLGGGEKYLLTMLEEAARRPDTEIVLFSPTEPVPADWRRLKIDIADGAFAWRRAGQLTVTPQTRGLDRFVALSNHVPPLSLARRSLAIVQFPSVSLRQPVWRFPDRKLRMASYQTVLCYSEFVAGAIRERLGVADPVVAYPPVDTDSAANGPKVRSIVAVGRFFPATDGNNKKHGLLIDAFRELQDGGEAGGWTLQLAGGCNDDPASHAYVEQLRVRAAGLPVQFHVNADRETLERLYAEATLFWHAAGHGERQPERWEHFGITTVEAMAHGCVPLVAALGGQLEIVTDEVDGRLWYAPAELVELTRQLIAAPSDVERMRAQALDTSKRFSTERFRARIAEEVFGTSG
jgi:glycosyltransferase involved in cell wall biosynthesis